MIPAFLRNYDKWHLYILISDYLFLRYIAPDASSPVRIPLELKREIVEVICDETGSVASQCFDKAQVIEIPFVLIGVHAF